MASRRLAPLDDTTARRRSDVQSRPSVPLSLEALGSLSEVSMPANGRRPGQVLALQRQVGNRAVAQMLAPAQGGPRRGSPGEISVSRDDDLVDQPRPKTWGERIEEKRTTPLSEREKWRQGAAHTNLPMDSGHAMAWLLHQQIIMKLRTKLKGDRTDVLDRAHVFEHNMYGGGAWGKAMRTIDMFSRISHLVGMLASITALICGAVGLVHPAALPVGAIAGIIALAAHGVMAVLQSILVGYNAKRIQSLPPAERAKVMPTLIRDIVKLCFAVIGVGLGAGGAAVAGMHGILATAALEGVEKSTHIGMMVGESVGETTADMGLFGGIAATDSREADLAMKGHFDQELADTRQHRQAKELAKGASGGPSPTEIDDLMSDASETETDVKKAKGVAVEAQAGVKGQDSEARALDELTTTAPKLQGTMNDLDASASDKDGTESRLGTKDSASLKATNAKLKEADKQLGDLDGGGADKTLDTAPVKGGGKTKSGGKSKATQLTVSRAPGWWKRASAWVKSKVMRIFARAKGIVAKLRTKLVAMTVKILGLRKTQLELQDSLVGKGEEATQNVESFTEAEQAAGEYRQAVAKMAVGAGRGGGQR